MSNRQAIVKRQLNRQQINRQQVDRQQRAKRVRACLQVERLELRQLMASDIGVSPIAPINGDPNYRGPSGTFPLDQTFELSSRPSATKTIYLDFDGHTVSGTAWNNANNGQDFYVDCV